MFSVNCYLKTELLQNHSSSYSSVRMITKTVTTITKMSDTKNEASAETGKLSRTKKDWDIQIEYEQKQCWLTTRIATFIIKKLHAYKLIL